MKSHRFVLHRALCLVGILAGLTAWPAAARAEDQYQGATAVLQKISGQTSAPTQTESPQAKEAAQLRRDIEAFKNQSTALAPGEAAGNWLALLDRLGKLPHASRMENIDSDEPLTFVTLLSALPPPPAWDALATAVEARPPVKGTKASREIALRLLAHTLTGNLPAQKADMAVLEKLAATAGSDEGYTLVQSFDSLNDAMLDLSADTNAIITSLDRQLARTESGDGNQVVSVPNLVSLVGTNRAEEFLRKALRTPNVQIQAEKGAETMKLARKLALELMPELKSPQWQLACSLDASQLYEALGKRFAKSSTDQTNDPAASLQIVNRRFGFDNGGQAQAQTYYLLGLIVNLRTGDAVALAQKLGKSAQIYLPNDALSSLENAGHGRALNDFFHDLLSKNPELPFWGEYVQIAARAGQAEEMLALARTAVARDDLTDRQRASVRGCLYRALLAADHVDEGVGEIRKLLASNVDENEESYSPYGGKPALGLMLARIGHLLEREDWLNEGVQVVRSNLTDNAASRYGYGFAVLPVQLAVLLEESGRGPEAETVLADALTRFAHAPRNVQGYSSGEFAGRQLLTALAELYQSAGRNADVVVLLDQAPQWEARDLAEIYAQADSRDEFENGHARASGYAGYVAAAALAATGQKEPARKIVDALLDQDGGFDPAYELLLQLGGADTLARLDALFAQDQFEERPLIWKAHLLRASGRLEDAESVARQAISVDPSDGEQGPGRRMRAYAELADIRQARGDTNQATFFREAVNAIRHSEQADKFYQAGLLSRAVKMYEESLNHFADAYCIQSRLALRMEELGLHEAAAEHYRRAYELMPESFGRVESHCFGCERVFAGEQAQSLAEKVFGELVVKTPAKPQVHYLLGYLREEQGRFQDALPEFQQAARLDPQYLNAWKHLLTAQVELQSPATERDPVVLKILSLDPLGRHGGWDINTVGDLRALWKALEVAARLRPVTPAALYPLAGAGAALDKKPDDPQTRQYLMRIRRYQAYAESQEKSSPAMAIAQQRVIATLSQMIDGNRFGYD